MSKTVDERVVSMQFDNKQFESGIKTSMDSINGLKKSLDFSKSAESFGEINRAAGKVSFSGLSDGVEAVKLKFSAFEVMAVTALTNITNSALNAGKKIVSALTIDPVKSGFSEYELKMNSVQTIMASTGETIGSVNGYLEELNKYADRTIYSFSDMTSNIGKFTNAGVKLEDAVNAIKGISNVAAVSGANSAEASRAMYNFSQALSAGYVKLIDWKSIENANMATVEFKTHLMDAAVAAGKLKKTSTGMYYNAEMSLSDAEAALAENQKYLFNASKNFNETLQNGWMTTEVLVSTLNEYSDETTDIGKKAYAAAQDVKTFTQLYDTLKEAAQSGWAQSWEIVVGDLTEAKKVLTDISTVVGGMLQESADARNETLFKALSSGWKQFTKEGIANEEDFKAAITDVAKTHNVSVDDMIKESGSFEASLKQGWLNADILSESVDKYTAKVENMSEADLKAAGYTKEQVDNLKSLSARLKDGTLSAEEFAKIMARPSGRENLFSALSNILEGLASILSTVRKAFQEVFPPKTAEQLYSITAGIASASEKFKEFAKSEGFVTALTSSVKGILTVFKIFGKVIGAVIKPLFSLGDGVGGVGSKFLDCAKKLGEWIVSVDEAIDKSGALAKVSDGISKVLGYIASAIGKAYSAIKNFFVYLASKIDFDAIGDKFKTALDGIKGFFEYIGSKIDFDKIRDKFKSVGEAIKEFFETLTGKINLDGVKQKFSDAGDSIKAFFSKFSSKDADVADGKFQTLANTIEKVENKAGTAKNAIVQFATSAKEKFEYTGYTSFGEAVVALKDDMTKLNETSTDVKSNASNAFDTIRDAVSNFVNSTPVQAFVNLFTAVWNIISEIAKAVGTAVVGVVGNLGDELKEMSVKDIVELIKSGAITAALIKFSKLLDGLGNTLGSLGDLKDGVVGVLDSVKNSMKTWEAEVKANVIRSIAVSILMLAAAVLVLSFIDPDKLANASAAVAALFVELMTSFNAFVKTSGSMKQANSAVKGIIGISAAVLIMALALKSLTKASPEQLISGVAAIGALLTELLLFISKFKNRKNIVQVAEAMVLLGAAVGMFTTDILVLGLLPWENLAKGVAGIGAILGAMVLFTDYVKNSKDIVKTGAAMVLIGLAIQELVAPLVVMSLISWEGLAKGILGIGALMAEFVLFTQYVKKSKDSVSVAESMMIIALAIQALAVPLVILSLLSWEGLAKGVIGIGALLAGLVAFSKFVKYSKNLMSVCESMLVLAAAIDVLAIGLLLISTISWEGLAKGFAVLVAGFVVLGAAGAILGPLAPVIASLATSFLTMGGALLAVGVGIAAVGAGVALLALGFVQLATLGTAGAVSVVAAMTVIVTGVLALLPLLISTISSSASSIGQMVAELLISLCGSIDTAAPSIFKTVDMLANGVLDLLSGLVPKIVAVAVELLASTLEKIAEYTPRIIKAIVDIALGAVVGLLDGIAANLPDIIQSGVDCICAFIEGVGKALPRIVDSAFKAAISFINGLADAFDNNTDDLISATNRLMESIVSAMKKWISNSLNAFKKVGSDLWTKFKEGVNNAFAKIGDIGSNIISGIVDGIKAGWNKIKDGAKWLGDTLVGGVKDFLGIHSPSTVFAELGGYCDKGLIKGVKSMAGEVADASADVGSNAIDSMRDAMSDVSDVLSSDLDLAPTIRPVVDLSQVNASRKTLSGFASEIGSLSGSTNLAYNVSGRFNRSQASTTGNDAIQKTLGEIAKLNETPTNNNTFNITGDNPKEIAQEVSKILQAQVERRKAVWA